MHETKPINRWRYGDYAGYFILSVGRNSGCYGNRNSQNKVFLYKSGSHDNLETVEFTCM